jgi:hypothetical protein
MVGLWIGRWKIDCSLAVGRLGQSCTLALSEVHELHSIRDSCLYVPFRICMTPCVSAVAPHKHEEGKLTLFVENSVFNLRRIDPYCPVDDRRRWSVMALFG